MSSFGLSTETIAQINGILSSYPEIIKVILYGSRAKGNYKKGSDIDLAIVSDSLSPHQLLTIQIQIDDLLLPYTVDLCLLRTIDNPGLIEHIHQVGLSFEPAETGE